MYPVEEHGYVLEHIPSMSLDSIEDFGEVGPDNSSEDLNYMIEVYSPENTSCQFLDISFQDFD